MNSILSFFKSRSFVFYALSFVLIFLIYLPTLPGPLFNIDDRELIQIPQLQNPVTIKTFANIFSVGTHIDYYPVRDLTYLVDLHVLGGSPFAMRLVQVLLLFGCIAVGSQLMILSGLKKEWSIALTTLWALNPVFTETVAWISSRKDLLAMFFALLSALFFLRKNKLGVWVFFILSLFSKASFVLLPFVGLLYILWSQTKINSDLLKLTVFGIAVALLQSWFYKNVNVMTSDLSFWQRVPLSMAALGKMVLGWFYWGFNIVDVENFQSWIQFNGQFMAAGVLFLICLGFLICYGIVKQKKLCFLAGLGGFILYLPVCGILFPHRNFYSTRYLLPSYTFLIFTLLVHFKDQINKKSKRVAPAMAGIFVYFLIGSFSDAHVWENPLDVRKKAVENSTGNLSLHAQFLAELINEKRSRGAFMDPSLASRLEFEKNYLDKKCVETGSLHQECWRYLDIRFQMSKLTPQDDRVTSQFLESLKQHGKTRSESRYGVLWKIKKGEPFKQEAGNFLTAYWFFPSPKLRFLKWISLCETGKTEQAQEYFYEIKKAELIDLKEFKEQLSTAPKKESFLVCY